MLAIVYEGLLERKNADVSADDAVMQAPLKDLEQRWDGGIFSAYKWIGVVYPAVF